MGFCFFSKWFGKETRQQKKIVSEKPPDVSGLRISDGNIIDAIIDLWYRPAFLELTKKTHPFVSTP